MSVEVSRDFISSCSFLSNLKGFKFLFSDIIIYMCLCFSGRLDHVTSYFGFSCNDFARLLCAGEKVCGL